MLKHIEGHLHVKLATSATSLLLILPCCCSFHSAVAQCAAMTLHFLDAAFHTLLLLGPPRAQLLQLLLAPAARVLCLGEDLQGSKAAEIEAGRSQTEALLADG